MNRLPEDIDYLRTAIANVVFVGVPGSSDWVLIDAGIMTYGDNIRTAAAERFGPNKPRAIILTHGHFDHVGSLKDLLEHWDVPVYAHPLEMPYLNGQEDYPPADPSVGGGLMAAFSPVYPHKGIDIHQFVKELPNDGSITELPEWRWIHTPGHTKGHISLYRDRDRMIIAGDAFITVKQESAWAVITQEEEIHGPPAYFTFDWQHAWASVRTIAELNPRSAITGHGHPMYGNELQIGLRRLAEQFDQLAIPVKA
ncbi:MBL fold metallo-hydrolase [Paenibacillus sp. R14(2021)]|uniref:MBL fold metallo-hydrolase n=1 Tax=Paenibacillus sp. R14(2021) TaxID=2859228 RepID=UPI001C615B2C|nr:MBL fold metallo-hydrolase [Paenibacillus sp. R14(2021)]